MTTGRINQVFESPGRTDAAEARAFAYETRERSRTTVAKLRYSIELSLSGALSLPLSLFLSTSSISDLPSQRSSNEFSLSSADEILSLISLRASETRRAIGERALSATDAGARSGPHPQSESTLGLQESTVRSSQSAVKETENRVSRSVFRQFWCEKEEREALRHPFTIYFAFVFFSQGIGTAENTRKLEIDPIKTSKAIEHIRFRF
jgi:hypothetical protein